MIYFIQAENSKAIKIGYTKGSVEKRLKTLQIGNHETLTLLGTTQGDKVLEKAIHYKLNTLLIRGEWFSYSSRILELITESRPHQMSLFNIPINQHAH